MYVTTQMLKNPAAYHLGDAANVRRIKAEQAIARKIVQRILKAGYVISVFDGEEYPCKRSADFKAIWDAMGETDEDVLIIRDVVQRIGSITLIWGNDEDLVSDYSWSTSAEGSQGIMDKLAKS